MFYDISFANLCSIILSEDFIDDFTNYIYENKSKLKKNIDNNEVFNVELILKNIYDISINPIFYFYNCDNLVNFIYFFNEKFDHDIFINNNYSDYYRLMNLCEIPLIKNFQFSIFSNHNYQINQIDLNYNFITFKFLVNSFYNLMFDKKNNRIFFDVDEIIYYIDIIKNFINQHDVINNMYFLKQDILNDSIHNNNIAEKFFSNFLIFNEEAFNNLENYNNLNIDYTKSLNINYNSINLIKSKFLNKTKFDNFIEKFQYNVFSIMKNSILKIKTIFNSLFIKTKQLLIFFINLFLSFCLILSVFILYIFNFFLKTLELFFSFLVSFIYKN